MVYIFSSVSKRRAPAIAPRPVAVRRVIAGDVVDGMPVLVDDSSEEENNEDPIFEEERVQDLEVDLEVDDDLPPLEPIQTIVGYSEVELLGIYSPARILPIIFII